MYNGVLDYKRFRKTPLPQVPPPIAVRGPKGPTGPSGTPYRPEDVYTGPTGTTGITGRPHWHVLRTTHHGKFGTNQQ